MSNLLNYWASRTRPRQAFFWNLGRAARCNPV